MVSIHSDNELRAIFQSKGVDKRYYKEFTEYYHNCISELSEDCQVWENEKWNEEDQICESALFFTLDYVDTFFQQIAEGHGKEWSRFFAKSPEEGDKRVYDAYVELEKVDYDLAQKEIRVMVDKLSDDELLKKYYLFLFEIGEGGSNPFEKSKIYAATYKTQIELGKSEMFAHEYSRLMAKGR